MALTIAARFNGPPDSGHGGYAAGLVAGLLEGPARVRLRRPPPLGRELTVRREGEGVTLVDGDEVIVTGAPATVDVTLPDPVGFGEAEAAAREYPGFQGHVFPRCFGCGPDRAVGDGLRIFPGPVPGRALVGAPWIPDRSLTGPTVAARWHGAERCRSLAAVARPDPDSDAVAVKAALRREILARRDALDLDARGRRSAAVLERTRGLDALRQARVVLGYASFGSELDTRPFLHAVLAGGRMLVLPRVDRAARRLALHEVRDLETELLPGTWGIPEPVPARCRTVAPAEVDFVLVPGLVFDPGGGRIGYGAGYYDRLLAAWPEPMPSLVAAAFELQVVPAVPVLAHDRRVDLVVTESRIYSKLRLEPTEGP